MIKQAIIPLAGLGTRLLPLSSVIPKELLPINGKILRDQGTTNIHPKWHPDGNSFVYLSNKKMITLGKLIFIIMICRQVKKKKLNQEYFLHRLGIQIKTYYTIQKNQNFLIKMVQNFMISILMTLPPMLKSV